MSGDDRTRTGDLSPDKRALSALSYAPTDKEGKEECERALALLSLEPATHSLQ